MACTIIIAVFMLRRLSVSFSQFFVANWVLFLLLGIVLAAIIVYEYTHRGHGGTELSNITASSFINNGALLLDTRPVAEFKKGHIAGAKNVPAERFADYAATLNLPKDKTIVLYCKSGVTVKTQAKILSDKGFEDVYTIKSGLDGWVSEHLPLVR